MRITLTLELDVDDDFDTHQLQSLDYFQFGQDRPTAFGDLDERDATGGDCQILSVEVTK